MRNAVLSLVFVLAAASSQTAAKGTAVQWQPFTQGLKSAASGSKYVFVSVYTDWCGYCKRLNAVTLTADPVVSELGRNFVSVKLNAESADPVAWKGEKMASSDLASLWGVDGFPTLIFLNSKGEVIGSFASYAEPDLMIKLLTYISSGARERKVSFEDYLKDAG
jgi:thioredoxin-related protein